MMVYWYFVRPAGHVLESLRAKGLEWIMAIQAALFGYALVQPGSTFNLSLSFKVISEIADYFHVTEEQIGWSMIFASIARLLILAYNGLWSSSPQARRILAFLFIPLWFMVFAGIFQSVGMLSTGNIYIAAIVGEIVTVLRTSWEIGRKPTIVKGKASDHANANAYAGH